MNARHILIFNEKPLFNSCLIKPKKKDESNEKATEIPGDDQSEEECASIASIASTASIADDVAIENVGLGKGDDNSATINEPKEQIKTTKEMESSENNVESLGELKEKEKEKEIVEEMSQPNQDNQPNQPNQDNQPNQPNQPNQDNQDNEGELVEVNLDLPQELDSGFEKIKLQNANEVYYKMYKEAKEKAKSAKKMAVEAYLAAEEIKFTYNLVDNESDSDDSESDNNDNESESDDENGDDGGI